MNPDALHTPDMTPEPEATLSMWIDTVDMPDFPNLGQQQLEAEICVVGAGIAGLTTAYLLAKAGKDVIVLDMAGIGSGQTGRTTAHLSSAIDDRFFEIERLHGLEASRLAASSQLVAIDTIEEIVMSEGIDCEFERLSGYLFLGPDDDETLLDQELEATHRAGQADVVKLPNAPLHAFHTGPVLMFPRQGQFHPLKYLIGLAQAITRLGGRIFTYSKVEQLSGGLPCRIVTASGGRVEARQLVVATNTPINNVVVMHTKQAAYRTYVLGYRVPRGSVEKGLYWDTPDPYHYIRVYSPLGQSYDVLIIGGEDHKVGQSDDEAVSFGALQDWARERFPMLHELAWQWSGQVIEPVDGLPFAGHNPLKEDNVWLITGDSGMGMTNCTIGALIVSDQILGRANPWAQLYDPARKTYRAALEFFRENANVAVALVGDRLGPAEVMSVSEIQPGMGALVHQRGQKLAVYRDEGGKLHACSAKCTHLGCIVHWNTVENTWDCPCHGSRFSVHGEVINGPAHLPLKPAEVHDDFHPGMAG
ncbi:MAG TPA: FAD-dependent oxidoreductase [Candidatus Obscuribacterales bacterium]